MKTLITLLALTFAMPALAGKYKRDFSKGRLPSGNEAYKCVGTEPFWSLEISDKKVTFANPDNKKSDFAGVKIIPASGVTMDVLASVSAGKGAFAGFVESGSLWIVANDKGEMAPGGDSAPKALCSDGMSDMLYPYAVHFVLKGQAYSGCCSTKSHPPIGQAGE